MTKRSSMVCARSGRFKRGFGWGPGNLLEGRGYRVRSRAKGGAGIFTLLNALKRGTRALGCLLGLAVGGD